MSDKHSQQPQDMMQEALDGELSEELTNQLQDMLNRDMKAAKEYDRLQRVDTLLKRAPHRRAPARLAATIMARLAEKVEQETQMQALPDGAQQVMMMSMTVAMMSMMPMMEAASWLVLNAQRDPDLLGEMMVQTIGLMSLMTDAMVILLEDAETLARTDPQVATATLALTPYMMHSILDYIEDMVEEHQALVD